MNRVNVDMVQGSVTFRGEKSRKGKFRTVFLDQYARRYLGMYLAARTDENPALFVSERKYAGEPRRLKEADKEGLQGSRRQCEGDGTCIPPYLRHQAGREGLPGRYYSGADGSCRRVYDTEMLYRTVEEAVQE